MKALERLRLLLLVLLPLVGCATTPPAQGPLPAPEARDAPGILRECGARRPADRSPCYQEALLALLRDEGVGPAMRTLEQMSGQSEEIRREGHGYAHAIGLSAFTPAEEVGSTFGQCTPAFQSGCYHGVIQAYFADHASQHGDHLDAATVNALCASYRADEASRWELFQCAHGMGHGVLMVNAYHLPRALEGCDLLEVPWEREACYGGAFMENVVQATMPHHTVGRPEMASQHAGAASGGGGGHEHHGMNHGAAPAGGEAFKALDPQDPLYPCSILDARYLGSCYQMQTSAVLFFNQGDVPGAARACDGAPEAYRYTCYQSLGRDISSITLQDHARAMRLCSVGDPRYQPACHEGYAKNLVDLTAQPEDGFAYCRGVTDPASKRRCYESIGEQIWVLTPERTRKEAFCEQAEPDFRAACRKGAGLTEP